MRFLSISLLLFAVNALGFDNHPSPKLGPLDVLEVILSGMATNDYPDTDAGLRQAFRFASPNNKAVVGPFWRFKKVVEQPQYAPLINHIERTIGDPSVNNNMVTIPLFVISKFGEIAVFTWILSMQVDGQYEGSWMTDAVHRVALLEGFKAL